ncbi:MAG: hypothetical protein EAZ95_12370 [Bacteroidetes bacterium]|nr:MAG: hypothetical protein EAZ95_12370 [Bacteroidota bacterium]
MPNLKNKLPLLMETINSLINTEEVVSFLQENNENISQETIEDFIGYLEVDFYEWVRSNWRSYATEKGITV